MKYEDYTAEITTADAQESYEKGVIVLVTGCLTGKDKVRKKFTQTFFLAPQDKGYYVLNDVFRYIEENEILQVNSVPVNGINENSEEVALATKPGLPISLHLLFMNFSDSTPIRQLWNIGGFSTILLIRIG